MPSQLIKSMAEKSGKSEAEIEDLWNDATEKAGLKFDNGTDQFYAYAVGILKRMLGLAPVSLKETLQK
jgi:hypothetical protein